MAVSHARIEDMAAIRLLNILWSTAAAVGDCSGGEKLFEHWSISSKLNTYALTGERASIFHQLVKKSSKTPFCGNFSQCGPCLTLIGRVGNRRNIMRPYFSTTSKVARHSTVVETQNSYFTFV